VQPNKAVVGRNAFAHESGIHQDGVLKERSTYEIMDAQEVGLEDNQIVLGKHSGRHALQDALQKLGYELSGEELRQAFRTFKELADRKKQITAMDLEALMTDTSRAETAELDLEWYRVSSDSRGEPQAHVALRLEDGMIVETSASGDGAFDSLFQALGEAAGVSVHLKSFSVGAVTGGEDALGEVSVVLEVDGAQGSGQAVSSDVLQAAAWAYLRAIARASHNGGRSAELGETP
jgi:2-isopropylmalate synthase